MKTIIYQLFQHRQLSRIYTQNQLVLYDFGYVYPSPIAKENHRVRELEDKSAAGADSLENVKLQASDQVGCVHRLPEEAALAANLITEQFSVCTSVSKER